MTLKAQFSFCKSLLKSPARTHTWLEPVIWSSHLSHGFCDFKEVINLSVFSLIMLLLNYLFIQSPPLLDSEPPAGGAIFCSNLYSQRLVQFPANIGWIQWSTESQKDVGTQLTAEKGHQEAPSPIWCFSWCFRGTVARSKGEEGVIHVCMCVWVSERMGGICSEWRTQSSWHREGKAPGVTKKPDQP